MRIRSSAREAIVRLGRASKTEFFLDTVNTCAVAYQFFISVYFAWSRYANFPIPMYHGWLFVASVGYANAHRFWLKGRFQKRKWVIEEERRAQAISVAVWQLAVSARNGQLTALAAHRIEQGLLRAMRSEIAEVVVDTEGIYLAVNLLVEDRAAPEMLFCLNRSDEYREPNATYPKDQPRMLPWEAMTNLTTVYEPCITWLPDKPYKTVLAMPITYKDGGGTVALGAVSIDSGREHHFDETHPKIARRLLPYVSLLALVLILRERYDAWP